MMYSVIQPLVVVRDDEGAQHMFYFGASFPSEGLDKDHVKMLLDEGFIEKASEAAKSAAGDDKPTTVNDIVDAVGTDKALAQQYLDEENKANKPRVSLVEKLQAVLNAE